MLLEDPFFLHGWLVVALNLFWYGFFCWMGWNLIRGAIGRERLLIIGWLVGFLVRPIEGL